MNAFPGLLRRLGICLSLFATQPCAAAWVPVADMPTPRKYMGAASPAGNTIYVAGGRTEYLPNTREYHPILEAWTAKKSMPTPRAFLAAVTVGGTVYAIGGTNGKTLGVVEAYDPATDSWTTVKSMLTPREHFAAAVVGGTIYVIGGKCGTTLLDTVEAYDRATDTWTYQSSIKPGPGNVVLAYHAAVAYGSTIYVIGGMTKDEQPQKIVFYYGVYDAPGGKWYKYDDTVVPNMGTGPLMGHTLVAMGNQLCVFGGTTNITETAYYSVMDVFYPEGSPPGSFVWKSSPLPWGVSPPPSPTYDSRRRNHAGAALDLTTYGLGFCIYAIGGRNSSNSRMNSLEVYSNITNTWSNKPSVPEMQDGAAATTVMTPLGPMPMLIVVGGYAEYLSAHEAYYPDLNKWASRAPLPTARAGLAVCAPGNGKIYAVGGTSGTDKSLATNEEYDPASDSWTVQAPMPTPRRFPAAVAVGGKLYVIGGVLSATVLGVNEMYNPADDTWTTRAPMTTPRFLLAAASVDGKIYAFGGVTSMFYETTRTPWLKIFLDDLEIYDPATDKWTKGKEMPMPLAGCGAAALENGMIFLSGGFDGTWTRSVTLRYNPALDDWVVRVSLTTCGYGINTCQGHAMVAPAVSTFVFAIGGENTGAYDFDTGGNWTSSGTIFNGCQRYIRDPATLTASVSVVPNPVDIGKSTTVYLEYVNDGDVTATGLVPSLWVGTGAGNVALTGGPFPSPGFDLGLLPGESASHAWTYAATAVGQATFCGKVDGTDEKTGVAVSANACNTVDPLMTAYSAQFTCSLKASPLPLSVGGNLEVVLAVANPGGGTSYDTTAVLGANVGSSLLKLISGPSPAGPVVIYPNATASFTWVYSVVSDGFVLFSATATGRDEFFGVIHGFVSMPTSPPTVTGFAARPRDNNTVRLRWDIPTEGITKYQIYKATYPDVALSATTFVTSTTFLGCEDDWKPGYFYKVIGSNPDGSSFVLASFDSSVICAKCGRTLADPGGICPYCRIIWNKRILMGWTPPAGLATQYLIYRGEAPSFALTSASLVGSTTGGGANHLGSMAEFEYLDTGLVNGRWYYYRIVTVNAGGARSTPTGEVGIRPISMPETGGVRITTNGPNPLKVNPIRGDLAQVLVNVPDVPGTLRITVYNLVGETVRQLRKGPASPGQLICDWDCRNDHGQLVASGGYFIVVELPNGKRVIRKVAIVK